MHGSLLCMKAGMLWRIWCCATRSSMSCGSMAGRVCATCGAGRPPLCPFWLAPVPSGWPAHTRPSADYLHVGATEDGDVRLAARYLGSAGGAVLLAAWVQAERLVDRYWGKILTIALELHRCHRLSGARVEALWHEMSDAA